MSYQRNTESWNNDPNGFSNPRGPNVNMGYERDADVGFQQQPADGGFDEQRGAMFSGDPRPSKATRPTQDPTDTSAWGADSTGGGGGGGNWTDGQHGRGQSDNPYAGSGGQNFTSAAPMGNTTDVNTYGAGGNQFPRSGLEGGVRDDDTWHSEDAAHDSGKPTVSEKLKGNVEKLADRISGRH